VKKQKLKYQGTNVPTVKIKPLLQELAQRCESLEKAAEYIGVGTSTVYRIMNDYHGTTQARVARLIILGLNEKRKEDRRNGASENFIRARKHQAALEERMERLTGY